MPGPLKFTAMDRVLAKCASYFAQDDEFTVIKKTNPLGHSYRDVDLARAAFSCRRTRRKQGIDRCCDLTFGLCLGHPS